MELQTSLDLFIEEASRALGGQQGATTGVTKSAETNLVAARSN